MNDFENKQSDRIRILISKYYEANLSETETFEFFGVLYDSENNIEGYVRKYGQEIIDELALIRCLELNPENTCDISEGDIQERLDILTLGDHPSIECASDDKKRISDINGRRAFRKKYLNYFTAAACLILIITMAFINLPSGFFKAGDNREKLLSTGITDADNRNDISGPDNSDRNKKELVTEGVLIASQPHQEICESRSIPKIRSEISRMSSKSFKKSEDKIMYSGSGGCKRIGDNISVEELIALLEEFDVRVRSVNEDHILIARQNQNQSASNETGAPKLIYEINTAISDIEENFKSINRDIISGVEDLSIRL